MVVANKTKCMVRQSRQTTYTYKHTNIDKGCISDYSKLASKKLTKTGENESVRDWVRERGTFCTKDFMLDEWHARMPESLYAGIKRSRVLPSAPLGFALYFFSTETSGTLRQLSDARRTVLRKTYDIPKCTVKAESGLNYTKLSASKQSCWLFFSFHPFRFT